MRKVEEIYEDIINEIQPEIPPETKYNKKYCNGSYWKKEVWKNSTGSPGGGKTYKLIGHYNDRIGYYIDEENAIYKQEMEIVKLATGFVVTQNGWFSPIKSKDELIGWTLKGKSLKDNYQKITSHKY